MIMQNLFLGVKEAYYGICASRECIVLERVSIECRKTKTKIITLANQKGQRQSSKPIKT